jgi:hypothetical protein
VGKEMHSLFFGLISKTERWGITFRGLLVIVLFGTFSSLLLVRNVYSFFAVSAPVESDLLIVEGWVPDYCIQAAAIEFHSRQYCKIVTTGGPSRGLGGYLNEQSTSAYIGAAKLRPFIRDDSVVFFVPSRTFERDRTYSSAVALAKWLKVSCPNCSSINVMTTDVHARRTRLLFQLALGRGFEVGIISVPNPDYNYLHWWKYSEGVRDVIGEAIAYSYAKLFFWPKAAPA